MSNEDWIKALDFAALPGAARVVLVRSVGVEDDTKTVNYSLKSLDADGNTIGDERDYDLLKAAMGPLERLSEAQGRDAFSVSLDLVLKQLDFSDA